MSGHCPAPWRLDGGVIRGLSATGKERPIAEVYREAKTTAETLANASLIAAAPDMCDALQGLLDFIDIDKLPMDEMALSIARAALAKASPPPSPDTEGTSPAPSKPIEDDQR